MSRGSVAQPRPTDARLAQARVRFLTTEAVEPGQVRDTILASWWRSRKSNVAADRIKWDATWAPVVSWSQRLAVPVGLVLHSFPEGVAKADAVEM